MRHVRVWVVFLLCGCVFGQVPRTLSFQGKLVGVSSPVDMYFYIYDTETGGTPLWTEYHPDVVLSGDGLFNVILGETNPIDLDFSAQYWLEVRVDMTVLPNRFKLTAGAYSIHAILSDTAKYTVYADTAVYALSCADGGSAQDTFVAYWDSLRNVPAGFADGTDDIGNDVLDDLSDNSINDLSDVNTSGVSIGQVLKWDGTNWIPANDSVGSGGSSISISQGTGISCSPNPITSTGVVSFDQSWGDSRYVNEGQSAGGDLTGSYPNPTVSKIQGRPVSSNAPSVGQVLKWDGSQWAPGTDETGGSGNWYLSGDKLRPNSSSWRVVVGNDFDFGEIMLMTRNENSGGAAIGGYAYGSSVVGVFGYCDNEFAGVQGNAGGGNYGVYGFNGDYGVYASGDMGCSGSKSAVVRIGDDAYEFYTVESPEIWFEDFGEAKLENGRAHIELEELFLQACTIDEDHPMQVFITPYSPLGEYYIVRQATGFDVIQVAGGEKDASFGYRVIAKRKGYENIRNRRVTETVKADPVLYPELRNGMPKWMNPRFSGR